MADQLRFVRQRVCILGLTLWFGLNFPYAAIADTDKEHRARPNIVFIFVDDQGYYDLGCYGATEVETPRIDALALNGVRFTDYYAAAPICSPSRTGLLTGCYPRRTGNEVWVHRPDSQEGIPPSRLTLAELFKNEGYATACIGKWHLGFEEQYLPANQGFDHYFGILHNLDSYEVVHYEDEGGMPLLRNGEVARRNVAPGNLARLYTEEAIAWIEERVAKRPRNEIRRAFLPIPSSHDAARTAGGQSTVRGQLQLGPVRRCDSGVGLLHRAAHGCLEAP